MSDHENITLRVRFKKRSYLFDIQIWHDEDPMLVVLAPRRIPGERNGCVMFQIDKIRGDPQQQVQDSNQIIVARIVHNPKCSLPGTPDLEKKYGTRAMILGALHCVKMLAETRWRYLTRFALQDESTYKCPPLDMKVMTSASDLFLQDNTYYERHLNMRLQNRRASDAKTRALEKIHGPVDLTWNGFWLLLTDESANFTTPEKTAWLEANKAAIRQLFSSSAAGSATTTWRTLFTALHDKFGCSFFAASLLQLSKRFGMMPIMGASYAVDFSDLPNASVETRVVVDIRGGGDAGSSSFPTQKMIRLKNEAVSNAMMHLSTWKYHRGN